jgi:hypothetical protein
MKTNKNSKPKSKDDNTKIRNLAKSVTKDFGYSTTLANENADNIANAYAPFSNDIKLLAESLKEVTNPSIRMSEYYKDYFESLHKLQKEILLPMVGINEMLKPLVESSKVFESLILAQTSIAEMLKGLVINLPLDGYLKELSVNTNFELRLNNFTSVKSFPDEYILGGTAIETIQHEQVGLKISTNFEMRFSTIESKIDSNSTKLDDLIKRDVRRDMLMDELVEYIKKTGNSLAKIKTIEYNNASTEITLDDMKIKLRGNTNQSDICQIVLKSKKTMQKLWEIEDIIEKMGESDSNEDWKRAVYDAVKEINTKILIETKGNIADFFLLTMKTVTVNPKYIG